MLNPQKRLRLRLYRVRVFFYLVAFVFTLLALRLWYLQVVMGDFYAEKSMANSVRLVPIPAPRGEIYDRRGRLLVTSRLSYTVSLLPRELSPEHHRVVRELSQILALPEEQIWAELKNSALLPYYPVRLKRDLDPRTLIALEEKRLDLPGVIVEEIPVRNYLYGDLAAHVFGYLGKISPQEWEDFRQQGYAPSDVIGKTGLERLYERVLKGKDGGQQVEVNRVNRPIRVLGTVDPLPGQGLQLTIDLEVQQAAEAALKEQLEWLRRFTPYKNARAGAAVVMDPRTGELLALASVPSFDPNRFIGGVDPQYWRELQENPAHPFTNRAVQSAVPPGSLFKPVTAVAALMEGVTNRAEIFVDRGRDPIYPEKTCWIFTREGRGHGRINLVTGLQESCNIVFYELGRRLGIERLAYWARQFGLGQASGLEFYPGELSGLVPDREWKRKAFSRPSDKLWYEVETMDVAIGQGALQTTPLQLATLYSALANGGVLYRPYLVKAILDADGRPEQTFSPQVKRRIPLRPEVVQTVREGMAQVVAAGTASGAFRDFPIPVAGKTGTVELGKGIKDTHAWFAGFAPVEDPQVVVVVFLERGGGGGASAAPVARRILEAYFGLSRPGSKTSPGAAPSASPVAPAPASPGPSAAPTPAAPGPTDLTSPAPAPVPGAPTAPAPASPGASEEGA
ncbi:MAG: penicillin-binding protein 2 [Bacillota bacterium]|nr:penicillin-binding protein 2 [Bacillota bacterium]